MKILSMTATFGKLDHKTLTLGEGLNVMEAPNEWGKSTWCAFIVAMLYGISTSSRKKTDFLPDKERYAPWCGKPMAGRLDLDWNGRLVTIERSQKGRIPFGNFRAYETETNVDIPELTADNCGQVLLGVEREVFVRAGFLKGSDLPVGEDEALRRRLNALVTTGDESGDSEALAQKLKDLKNSCRFNRTGLIPQAEKQTQELQDKLDQLEQLKGQCADLQEQEQQQAEYAGKLKNHQVALAYEKSLQTQNHVNKAQEALSRAREKQQKLEEQCNDLPPRMTALQEMDRLHQLQRQCRQLREQEEVLPKMPPKPEPPEPFRGKDGMGAVLQADNDASAYKKLCKPVSPMLLILAAVLAVAGIGLIFVSWIAAVPCLLVAAVCVTLHIKKNRDREAAQQEIAQRYGNTDPDSWIARAVKYRDNETAYEKAMAIVDDRKAKLDAQKEGLKQTAAMLTQGKPLAETLEYWEQVAAKWQALEDAQRAVRSAEEHATMVAGLVQTAPKPECPDALTLSETQTDHALQQTVYMQNQLRQRLGQCQGQMAALGDRADLEQALTKVQERLSKLEGYNAALTMALETLQQTTTELQRRFAPRIASRAKALFEKLTGGRYDRLLLASDLSMEVAATDEDTPHGVLWRSDGTADGLYLALRLAVAEELTPDAPLVLDDAFVRFDDTRLAAAMEILKEYAENKQVILFTCQTREKKMIE